MWHTLVEKPMQVLAIFALVVSIKFIAIVNDAILAVVDGLHIVTASTALVESLVDTIRDGARLAPSVIDDSVELPAPALAFLALPVRAFGKRLLAALNYPIIQDGFLLVALGGSRKLQQLLWCKHTFKGLPKGFQVADS